ncbi:coiled-coil domain-containing protein 169 isoform X3 [Archocentrus centrarchus]|uniref:coiled-coil domain-containing protein 169 isoform X3 n=1 Tax=Archocentrus centrarchus TaxID=63155 RepID=UPI0011E9DF9C|nr:coiled-coil domain-containing protein 169 isoform X3 [Archocentrus centrarchus]
MSKASDYSKYGLARLQAELEQEREMKQMLEESVCDLRSTMCELQERLQSVDGEGNEWKTRYETQVELNGQLERQLSLIHERLEDMKGNPVDRLASIRSYEDMPLETLRHRLKLLTEEKSDLQTQLMDCHLQIGQEGKLSSTHEARRMRHFARPQRAPESKEIRGKQTDRKAEADSKKGKEGGEEEGGEACVKERGGGGGGRRAERKEEKKLQRKSRLPTLKHNLKHNP